MQYTFYDEETTDIDLDFGQILQIGAIVCDEDFNELTTHDLRSRLQPWVVPSPSALLITDVNPDDLEDQQSYYEMIKAFDSILRQSSGRIGTAGYNSIGFDDVGIRSAFHQNLLETKLTSAKDENGQSNLRIDVMLIVQASIVHRPDLIKLENKTARGNITTTLGEVCRQNGISLDEDDAHEAIADVRATIELAKLIRERDPEFWDHMVNLSTQEGVEALLEQGKPLCQTETFFGRMKNRFIAPVVTDPDYDAQNIAFDLSYDPKDYADKTPEEICKIITAKKKTAFIQLRTNKCPTLVPADQTDPSLYPKGVDLDTMNERAEFIQSNPEFQDKVAQAALLAKKEYTLSQHVEKQIYDPIPEAAEPLLEVWKNDFHHANSWDERLTMVREFPTLFAEFLPDNPGLQRFADYGYRIIFDNAPHVFPSEELTAIRAKIYERIMNPEPHEKMITIPKAREDLAQIREDLAAGTCKFLEAGDEHKIDALERYYDRLEARYAPIAEPAKGHGLSHKPSA